MDERRYAGDDDQHHGGQRVDLECPGDLKRADGNPFEQLDVFGIAAKGDVDEDEQRQNAGDADGHTGDDLRPPVGDDAAEKSRDERSRQRQEDNQYVKHRWPASLSSD